MNKRSELIEKEKKMITKFWDFQNSMSASTQNLFIVNYVNVEDEFSNYDCIIDLYKIEEEKIKFNYKYIQEAKVRNFKHDQYKTAIIECYKLKKLINKQKEGLLYSMFYEDNICLTFNLSKIDFTKVKKGKIKAPSNSYNENSKMIYKDCYFLNTTLAKKTIIK